jgi:hypothetical protein
MPAKPAKKNTKRSKELRQAKRIQAPKLRASEAYTTFQNYSAGGNWLNAEWLEGFRAQRYVVG